MTVIFPIAAEYELFPGMTDTVNAAVNKTWPCLARSLHSRGGTRPKSAAVGEFYVPSPMRRRPDHQMVQRVEQVVPLRSDQNRD